MAAKCEKEREKLSRQFLYKLCAEKHQEKKKRYSQGEQKCSSKRELKAKEPRHNIHNILEESRESKNVIQRESYVGGRELVSIGVPHKEKNKRNSVLGVLFFMCESVLGCTGVWVCRECF